MSIENLNVEVYEFKLENYPGMFHINPKAAYSDVEIKTIQLDKSDDDECSIISTIKDDSVLPKYDHYPYDPTHNPYSQTNPNMIRSCDPLKGNIIISQTTTEQPLIPTNMTSEYKFMLDFIDSDDLIKFINLNGAKKRLAIPIINNDKIYTIERLYTDNSFIDSLFDDIEKILEKEWIIDNIKHDNNTNSLIKKIHPTKKEKFVIIGDLHGSLSTFIRILFRLRKMNVMDNKCNMINNYHLVLIGDLVDRGIYGYEICMLLLMLKKINPNNVHINKGNHEVITQNTTDGFFAEIKKKFPMRLDLHDRINSIFDLISSAILILNPLNNKYTYISHGGLPINYPSFKINDSIINLKTEYKNIIINNNDILFPPSLYAERTINSILWSDYWGEAILNKTNLNRIKIGYNILNETNETIELIIRGHQDGQFNTKLIRRGEIKPEIFTDINTLPVYKLNNKQDDKVNCYKFTHLLRLENNKIKVNDNDVNVDDFLKVLTISTNTDTGRELEKDSFVILKYIEEYNHNLDRCVISESDDEENIKINRNIYKLAKLSHEINNSSTKIDLTNHQSLFAKCLSKIK
jgi:hypothetical protein